MTLFDSIILTVLQPGNLSQMSVIPKEVFEKYAMEYQAKISESGKNLAIVKGQLQAKERERKMSQLTGNELGQFTGSTIAYRSVGKT
jgi:prefoldin subunit 1